MFHTLSSLGSVTGFILLALVATVVVLLCAEWKILIRYVRIHRESLASIEKTMRRVPGSFELVATNALTILIAVLSVQFVAKVYAMSFMVYNSSPETKDTVDMVMADVDGDGDLDYAAGNTDNGAPTQGNDLYRNDGSMSFTRVGGFGDSTNFERMTAADMDNDGDIDIVTARGGAFYAVSVHKNLGGFSFADGYSYSYVSELASVKDVALTDVDNDGDIDIVVATSANVFQAVHLNDGHGNFTAVNSPLIAANRVVAADFNSDGYSDIASIGAAGLRVYRNSGTGAFSMMHNDVSSYIALAPLDVENDGDIDIIAVNSSSPAEMNVYLNNGDGTFAAPAATSLYNYGIRDIALADFDNDGDIDYLDAASEPIVDNGNELWVNNGAGTFASHWQAAGGDDSSTSLAVGDLDGDGVLDYVLGRENDEADDRLQGTNGTINTSPTAVSVATLTGVLVPPTPKYPATTANDNSAGASAWNNTANAMVEDGLVALDGTLNIGQTTNYLKLTNFKFNIPTTATILGIKVEVKKRRGIAGYNVTDSEVKLVKSGTIQGSNRADTVNNWPAALAFTTYGGATDLWGLTLTPSDINASNFGFVISGLAVGGSTSSAFNVDVAKITVYYSMRDIRLMWGSGSDAQTPTRLLQYQLQVGTGSNSNSIVSSVTASPNWVGRVMPNGQSKQYLLRNLPCGHTFYWKVAAVDTGFRSAWSSETTFSIDASCSFSGGGSGGGSGGSSGETGGGLSWNTRNQGKNDSGAGSNKEIAYLTVGAWNDVNGDGRKQQTEEYRFKDLPVYASGSSFVGKAVKVQGSLNDKGQFTFELPPSDERGYFIYTDTGSEILSGFSPTTQTFSGGILLASQVKKTVSFGFIRADLLRYRPCLDIGNAEQPLFGSTESAKLMIRLQDVFGINLIHDVSLTDELVSRRSFFELLARSNCIELERDPEKILPDLKIHTSGRMTLPLIDLPLNLQIRDSVLMYTLLSKGITAERITAVGAAADLSSPVTRREAINAMYEVMKIAEDRLVQDGELPVDIEPQDSIAPKYLTLKSLGVLPDSFLHVFGENKGLNPDEAQTLLVRAAFRAGMINLLPLRLDQGSRTSPKEKRVPTFLAELPKFKLGSCLLRYQRRASELSFSDLLPGDTFFADSLELVNRYLYAAQGKKIWLLTGTLRPTEYGVEKGLSSILPSSNPSILEIIRTALVLSCVPPYTPSEVHGKGFDGSASSKLSRDRISNLPRDTSYASRVLYRAQDHQREYDLSFFTYAEELLFKEIRSPASPMTLEEASAFLASALLRISVLNGDMSPQEAEEKASSLKLAIAIDLLNSDVNWRDQSLLAKTLFTREMMIEFLATVVQGRTYTTPSTSLLPDVSLGEVWWERVK